MHQVAATLSQEEFPVRIASLTGETTYAIDAKRHHISTIEPHKPPQGAGTLSPAHSPAQQGLTDSSNRRIYTMVTIMLFVVALQMNYFLFRWLARNRFKPNEPGTFVRNVTVGFFGGIVPLAIQALVPPMIPPPFREAPSWKLMIAFIIIAIIFDSRLWKIHKDTREQLSQ